MSIPKSHTSKILPAPHHGLFPSFLLEDLYLVTTFYSEQLLNQELQWEAAAVLLKQPILHTPPNPWCACVLQAIIFLTLLTLEIQWYCLWTLVTNSSQSHHNTCLPIAHWAGQLQDEFGLNAINQGMMLRSTRQVLWFTFYYFFTFRWVSAILVFPSFS